MLKKKTLTRLHMIPKTESYKEKHRRYVRSHKQHKFAKYIEKHYVVVNPRIGRVHDSDRVARMHWIQSTPDAVRTRVYYHSKIIQSVVFLPRQTYLNFALDVLNAFQVSLRLLQVIVDWNAQGDKKVGWTVCISVSRAMIASVPSLCSVKFSIK